MSRRLLVVSGALLFVNSIYLLFLSFSPQTPSPDPAIILPDSNEETLSTPEISQDTAEETAHSLNASCFPRNSLSWLKGPRHGNIVDVDGDAVREVILNLPHVLQSPEMTSALLQETLALNTSQFLDFRHDQDLRRWSIRLIYLAFYYHQHQPALKEAAAYSPICHKEREDLGIGPWDYECPNTKFLVIRLKQYGLGYNVQSIATAAMLAGLASNRVVLFVNNVVSSQFEKP